MEKSIIHALCVSTRSLGYPKRKELRLEAEVRGILKTRGVRGVVRRMKDLQMTRQYALQGQRRSSWVAMSRKGVMPRRAAERDLWALSDRKFFAITGAVLQSCQKEVDGKDLLDWYSTASEPGVKPSSRLWKDPSPSDEDTLTGREADELLLALKQKAEDRNLRLNEDTRKWMTSDETPLALKSSEIYRDDPTYDAHRDAALPTAHAARQLRGHMRSLGMTPVLLQNDSGQFDIWSISNWIVPGHKIPSENTTSHPCANGIAQGIADTAQKMSHVWDIIADDLLARQYRSGAVPFRPSDMKGSAFPIGRSILMPKTRKEGKSTVVDTESLLAAYQLSRISAPALIDDEDSFVSRLSDVMRIRRSEFDKEFGSNGYFLYDVTREPASVMHWYAANEQYSRLNKPDLSRIDTSVVGIISFLAKPGTKVRVVANPNRRVQAALTPLGLSLQDIVYHNPALQPHIDVEDQDHGRLAVSSALKSGRRLASVDLSSATDTIDFGRSLFLTGYYHWQVRNAESIARGYRLISGASEAYYAAERYNLDLLRVKPDILNAMKQTKAFTSANSSVMDLLGYSEVRDIVQEFYGTDEVMSDVAHALLDHSMRMFDRVRTSDWSVDLSLNPNVPDTFQFQKGQPLGTRPSFPLLTMTNVAAAVAAGASWYHVVGDDIILDDGHYREYAAIMTDFLGSKVNDSKTLRSEKVAEFVGYIFDNKGRIYPKKPRITGSKIENALKFGPEQPSVSELIGWSTLSKVPGMSTLAEIKQDDTPFLTRISSAPHGDSPSVAMRLAARYLQELIEDESPTPANSYQVNGNLFAAHLDALSKGAESLPAEIHASSVEIPVKEQHFDHRTNQYETDDVSVWHREKRAARAGKLAYEVQNTGDGLISHADMSAVLDKEGNFVVAHRDTTVAQGSQLISHLAEYLSTHDHPGVAEYKSSHWEFSPTKGANVKSDTSRRKGKAPMVERVPSDRSVESGPELG